MKKLWTHLSLATMCGSLALGAGGVTTANADEVVIPPTPISGDPDQQRLNSIATLNAFHEAIDGAPEQGRVIQLQAGVYDFGAIVISDPAGAPPENYSVGLGGSVHYFNPYGLVGHPPYEETGHGVAILGKQHLTIIGASSIGGTPTTIVRGCTTPECLDFYSPVVEYNVGFSIGGDYGVPSRFVTIENIAFEKLAYALIADSGTSNPDWAFTDPRFGEGTEDLLIENNLFTDVIENFIGRKQLRPAVRGNKFVWTDPTKWNAHLAILGLPNGDHPVDAIIEDNTFNGAGWIAVLLMNNHQGTIVKDNHFDYSTADQCIFGDSPGSIGVGGGWHGIHPVTPSNGLIEDNTIDSGCIGIWVWGNSGWEIRDNTVHNASYGVWTEWGPPWFDLDAIFQPTVAEDNLVIDNDLRFNSYGVFIGARSRNNIYHDNKVKHNAIAGYYLNAPEDFGWIILGPPSGNIIIDAKPQSVVDMSGCNPAPGGCPQIDEDGDGLYSEDPVDNINNDGDSIFGYSMNDEDLEEIPNIFIND